MARFYSNENFPRRAVEALRELGHEVLTSLEAGRANKKIPDDEVLQFAKDEERILLTMNRKDFFRLHRNSDAAHAGIVACTQNPDPQASRWPRQGAKSPAAEGGRFEVEIFDLKI